VLDEAGALLSIETEDRAIDEDVERFRGFLDEVDPAEFEKPEGRDEPPDNPRN
jgi:hypothetical protein